MSNNYLKHYGIKKSKWSPQARAKYDARNRQLYGDENAQSKQRQAQSTRGKPPATNYKPQVAPKAGSNIGVGKKDPIDRRLKESKTWNSLTPEQRKRAIDINNAAKRANKQYTSYFGLFSSTPGRYLAKRNRKKRDGTETLLKYAEEVKKADESKKAREAKSEAKKALRDARRESKQATSSGSSNSGFGANIIKRTPGRKTVEEAARNRNDRKRMGHVVTQELGDPFTRNDRKQMGRMVTQDLGNPITRNDRKQMGRMVTQDTGTRRSSKGNSLPIGQTVAENLQNGGKQSALPKTGLIFKQPQAKAIGKVAKKNAHRVKANAENQNKEKQDKKAVEEYNRLVKSNANKYSKQTYTDTDFWGNKRTRTFKELKESKNPFDRIGTDYKLIKTTDNKLVRGLKKAYNSLGGYNVTPDQWTKSDGYRQDFEYYDNLRSKENGSKSSLPRSGIIRRKKAKSIGSAVKKKK